MWAFLPHMLSEPIRRRMEEEGAGFVAVSVPLPRLRDLCHFLKFPQQFSVSINQVGYCLLDEDEIQNTQLRWAFAPTTLKLPCVGLSINSHAARGCILSAAIYELSIQTASPCALLALHRRTG
jgi:hypothetical protein